MIRSLTTKYGGRRYRSRTEARWGVFFDACGIAYQYEPEGFGLRSGAYLPDFYLTDFGLYFEVKGQTPTEIERAKAAELADGAMTVVLIAVGPPDERFQIHWFDQNGEDENALYAIAADAAQAGRFWLVSEDQTRWLGGAISPVAERGGPVFSPLAHAYELALSARFEANDSERPKRSTIKALDHWRAPQSAAA